MDLATLTPEQLRRLIANPANAHVRPALERRLAELEAGSTGQAKIPGNIPSPASTTAVVELKRSGKRRGEPNQTEARYARDHLEPALARGEFARFEYEAITFHLHQVAKYTPDWVVWLHDGGLWVIEVKMHIWEKDRLRFRAHAAARPWIRWTMVQWTKQAWRVVYDIHPN